MYEKFFGLKEKPFNLTPDPKFLYLSQSHREALAHMIYGVNERKGFMIITGEVGTGKTTLLHALLKNLGDDIKTIFVFNPILDVKDFFKFVFIDLGIQIKDQTKGDYLLQLYQFLIESYRKNKNVVMIIDEAHNLNPFILEEIRLISNFETATDKLVQIILVGQPELSTLLNQSKCRPLKQRISLCFSINPLTREETSEYISSRLHIAGMKNSCFTEKGVDEIFHYSNGIPRVINILCDNSLTNAYAMDKKEIDENIVIEVIADLEAFEPQSTKAKKSPAKKDMVEAPNPGEKSNNPGVTGSKLTWKFPNEI